MSKKKKKKSIDLEKLKKKKDERELAEKKIKKRETFIFVSAAVVLLAVAIAGMLMLFHKDHSAYDTVVFKVGDEKVRLDEVNLCILQNVTNLGITQETLDMAIENGKNADSYYKQEILELIMNYKVENMIADRQGITLTDGEEKQIKNDALEYYGKINARVFGELGITKDRVVEFYRQRYIAHKLETSQSFDIDVEDDQFATIYLMLFPKVKMSEDGNFETEEDGRTPVMLSDEEIAAQKEKADAAYKELTEDKAEVTAVAEKYGVDKYSSEKSDFVSNFDETFSKYVKDLSDGQYSKVFDIESCYCIIKMINSNNKEKADQIMTAYKSDKKKEELKKQINLWYQELGIAKEPEFTGHDWERITLYDFVQYAG